MLEEIDFLRIRTLMEERLKPVTKSLKNVEADLRKVRRDINTIIGFFDESYLELRERVENIGDKVGIKR